MAKNAVAKRSATGSSVVPDYMKKVEMSGRGTSTDISDNLIPMARVLQKLSPEVEKKHAKFIPGAEAGDIYVKNAAHPIIKAEDGFLFQPCYHTKKWVEWLPRGKGGGGGGGYVTAHDFDKKPKVREAKDPMNPERTIEVRTDNGNVIVETRYHGGYVIPDDGAPLPLMIPLASSGHTVAKKWHGLMNSKMMDGVKVDSWCVYYMVKTVFNTKGDNSWFMFEIGDAGPEKDGVPTTMFAPTLEDFERGQQLFNAMLSGEKTFKAGDEAETPDDGKI